MAASSICSPCPDVVNMLGWDLLVGPQVHLTALESIRRRGFDSIRVAVVGRRWPPTHRCWVEYVVVGLNSLSLGFIRVVSPYSPSLRWIWLSLWWSFGGSPWDGVVVAESLVSAAPLVVVVCVLIQWQSTVLFALLFAALALGTGVVSGMARLRKGKTNHDFHRGSSSGRTGWASQWMGPPSCSPLPNSFIEQE